MEMNADNFHELLRKLHTFVFQIKRNNSLESTVHYRASNYTVEFWKITSKKVICNILEQRNFTYLP